MLLLRQRYAALVKDYYARVSKEMLCETSAFTDRDDGLVTTIVERRQAVERKIDELADSFDRRDYQAMIHHLTSPRSAD